MDKSIIALMVVCLAGSSVLADNSLLNAVTACSGQLDKYCPSNSTDFCTYMLGETLALRTANTSCADAFVHLRAYNSSTYVCSDATVGGATYCALGCASDTNSNANLVALGGTAGADVLVASSDKVHVAANATATAHGIPTTGSSSSLASSLAALLGNLTHEAVASAKGQAAGPSTGGFSGVSNAAPSGSLDYVAEYSNTSPYDYYYDPSLAGYVPTDYSGYTNLQDYVPYTPDTYTPYYNAPDTYTPNTYTPNTYTPDYPTPDVYTPDYPTPDVYTPDYNDVPDCSGGCYDPSADSGTGGYYYN